MGRIDAELSVFHGGLEQLPKRLWILWTVSGANPDADNIVIHSRTADRSTRSRFVLPKAGLT
jgi:hypothetical protein